MSTLQIPNVLNWISGDVAIDLGTANTLIWLKGRGIVVNEPSIVTRNVLDDSIVAVGDEAKAMLGKTHRELETIRPLQDGVIADFKMTDGMLQGFIRKINLNRLARPRMVICVPSGVTEVERRAVKDSGERANAREVYLIEEPVAAAIGIGLDISQPIGNIIVDIGGGTTEIAVISLNGVVTKETIRIAGDEMDEAVLQWFRNEHKLEIGLGMSEKIKKTVGSAMKMKSADIAVKGRDLVSGIPKTIEVSSDEVRLALKDPVNQIVEAVKRCLEQTPPELAADILERGIILAGGGSLLKGIDQIIRERTNVPVNVSEDPLLSVVKGTGMVLENLKKYEAVLLYECMYSFYLLSVRYTDHFLFIIALAFSLVLLLNNDNPKMGNVRGKAADVISFFSSPVAVAKSLMFLEEENQLLREKTLSLSLQVESMLNLQKENEELLGMLDFKRQTKLIIRPARVVNKGTQANLLSIIIDGGQIDGIKKNQAVLTPDGVIGKTIESGSKASIVQLISDANFRLSVRILPSGATGILRFMKGNTAQIREVQKNVNINIGDKVVTSGFSDIYPSGLPVGKVEGVYEDRSSFQKMISVALPNDMSSFQYVFVIIEKLNEMD